MNKSALDRTRGFTLIELLVVLLILSVLLVATPIAFDRILPSLEIEADARDLANLLRDARGQAIRRNIETTVVIDVARRIYWLGETGGAGPGPRDREGRFADGITVTLRTATSEQVEENVGRIRFFPDGTSTGGGVMLDRRGRRFNVEVDWLYGHVRLEE